MFEVYDVITGRTLYMGTHDEARQWIMDHEWDDEYRDARMRMRSAG